MWLWFVLFSSLYIMFIAFAMDTKNLLSFSIFKFVPFLLGLGSLIYFLLEMKLI